MLTVTNKVSCAVRTPAELKVTAVRLFAEERVKTWCCFTKTISTPILDAKLDNKRRHNTTDARFVYPDCRVKVNLEKIADLEPDCSVKLKVKRGELTLRKKLVDAQDLIHCLQEPSDVLGQIHVAFDVSSYYPLIVGLAVQTRKTQSAEAVPDVAEAEGTADETRPAVAEASSGESVQDVPQTITDEPPQAVPVANWESLTMETTTEADTDDDWEDLPLSDTDEGELNPDDGGESDKYPLKEAEEDLSCFKGGLGTDEEQTKVPKVPKEEAAPVGRSGWEGMWRTVRRVVRLSVLGVLAVTAVLVVLEPMLPDLDADEA